MLLGARICTSLFPNHHFSTTTIFSLLCKASVANIPGGIARLLEPNPHLCVYPRRRDARLSKDLSAPALRVEPPGGDGQSQRNKRMGTRIPHYFRTLDNFSLTREIRRPNHTMVSFVPCTIHTGTIFLSLLPSVSIMPSSVGLPSSPAPIPNNRGK